MEESKIYYVVEEDNTITVGKINSLGKFIPRKSGFRFLSQALSWCKNRKLKKKKRYGYNYSKETIKLHRKIYKEKAFSII